jgi:hypothetical protein
MLSRGKVSVTAAAVVVGAALTWWVTTGASERSAAPPAASAASPTAPEASPHRRPPLAVHATFAPEPRTLDELVEQADAAAEVTVTGIETRTENPSAEPPHADGSGLVDKQRITFRVEDVVYGEPPADFTIEKLGSQAVAAEGDPPYQVGERYLLFLEPLPDVGLYVRTSRTGRLKVKPDGTLETFVDFELARKFKDKGKDEVKRSIKDKAKKQGKA